MRIINPFLAVLILGSHACSQPNKDSYNTRKNFKVIFYNVENLFDTVDTPFKNDEQYLPNSKLQWNTERYLAKLTNLSKVIVAAGSAELPELVGLCEVENKTVVEYLANRTDLANGGYGICHFESPDKRGIDVALLYRKKHFTPLKQQFLRINFDDPNLKTRDILYVKGRISKRDTLHVYVNHWSSRRGGKAATDFKRNKAALVLRQHLDSLLQRSPNAKVIIMGDFNDYPEDESVYKKLRASNSINPQSSRDLFNLMYNLSVSQKTGSHYHKGHWGILDQVMISYGLINATRGLTSTHTSAYIFKEDWMLYSDKKGNQIPNRTYGGPNYYGGYSNHLPVVAVFQFKK